LDGPYCSRCGEERLDPAKLTVWHFLTRSVPAEVFDLDSKIWRTLWLLLSRPGFLAIEYAAGRRRRYVKPLRVLLTVIVVYALSTASGSNYTLGWKDTQFKLSVAPAPLPAGQSVDNTLLRIDRFGILGRMYGEKMGPVDRATDDVRGRFSGMLNAVATPLSFTSVALFALALYACFRRRRALFVEHAVFSMHYFSFVLLSSLILIFGMSIGLKKSGFVFIGLWIFSVTLWQFAYLAVAIRRFYFAKSRKAVARAFAVVLAALLYVLNSFFITAVQFLAGAVAIWRL